jgi:hypothetical protein
MATIDHTAMTAPAAMPPGTPIRNARSIATSPTLTLQARTRPKRTQRHGEPSSPKQVFTLSTKVYEVAPTPDCQPPESSHHIFA